jgi:hypothetical protein
MNRDVEEIDTDILRADRHELASRCAIVMRIFVDPENAPTVESAANMPTAALTPMYLISIAWFSPFLCQSVSMRARRRTE